MEQFTSGGNAGVVYLPDFNEIWTSKWHSNKITIWYFYGDTLFFSEDTTIAGVDTVRGMTYDGIYIYAGNNSNSILILDPYSLELVGTVSAPQKVRYITFDPSADNNNGGFWIGNFQTDPTLIDRDGNIIRSISYSSLGNTSIYGAVYDFYSSDGPFLWFWGQGFGDGWPQVITQVDPSTGLLTGEQYDVRDDAIIGEDSCLAGGLFITDSFYPDKIVLGGVLQGKSGPDILFGYDISGTTIIIIFAPTVTTNSATNITENSATLNGTINPNSSLTTAVFEYGTTTSYGNQITATQSPVIGSTDVNVNANLTGLQPNTTYHYRVKGTNDGGVSLGSDITFITSTSTVNAPIVTTSSATNITENTATLNGKVNPNNSSTTVTFEYGTTVSYTNEVTAKINPIDGNLDVDVSANITGLQPDKTYHYRVKGTSSEGVSVGEDVTFTTSISIVIAPTVTTTSATNISSSSANLNGIVNANNSSTNVIFEYGTTTVYGNQVTATPSPIDGNNDTNVSANLIGLQPNTLYHYRIVGNNNGGISWGSDITFTTSANISPPTASTLSATNITSSLATLNGLVNPNNLLTAVSFQYGTTTAYDSQVGADQSPISGDSNEVSVSATITGLLSNTLYHFRILATGGEITVNGSDRTFTTGIDYPALVSRNKTFIFNDLTANSYRMIGLPGKKTNTVHDMISGTQKKDWNVFYDNGTNSEYLKEFDGTSTFNFSAGNGFWVLSKNSFSVNDTVETVELSGSSSFDIDLHTETGGIALYKIISNPFEKNISWANIQSLNSLNTSDYLFDWTGIWAHASQMEPYKAYYFINVNNLSSLKIPYGIAASKISKPTSLQDENPGNNFIKLSLIQSKQEKSYIIAGFNSSAVKDYDQFDSFAPPGYFDEVRIHIEEEHLSFPYKQLFVSYRPEISEGQIFDLKIKNVSKKAVDIVASGLENFEGNQVYLLDENLNRFFNLKEKSKISVSPIHSSANYKLLIGNKNFISDIKKDYMPKGYILYQNFPNPFNPSTIIKYQIPDDNTFVELKIFNILGKEMITLVNEIQASGIYEVEFNASNLSSGAYFYSLKAGNYSVIKKMVLIK